MQLHALHALFCLCRVDRVNQETATLAGVVPHLQRVCLVLHCLLLLLVALS